MKIEGKKDNFQNTIGVLEEQSNKISCLTLITGMRKKVKKLT